MLPDSNFRLAENSVEIWTIRVADYSDKHQNLLACLDSDEKLRFVRFTNPAAREGFLVARSMLRQLLGCYLQILPEQVKISAQEHGKPFLPEKKSLHFNISHSHGIIVMAFSDRLVGIDVEFFRRKVDFKAVMRRFFSEKEYIDWQQNCTPTPEAAFFRGWTRKEAILKATGEGISGLGHTEISFAENNRHALCSRFGKNHESTSWYFQDFCPADGFQASITVNSKKAEIFFREFYLPAKISLA